MDLLWFHNDVIIGTFPQPSLPHTSERSKWPLLWKRRCLNVSSNFETYLLLNEMNSFSETNRILYKISNEMRDRDLQNIKHLCHGRIPLGDLEKSKSPSILFQFMLQRRMISPGNLSHLERLLTQIGRADLAGKIQTNGNDTTMETESAVSSNSIDKSYRAFLMKLSDELTRDNVDSLKFVADLPGN